ncbi:MAG: hypothetical protein VXY61_06440 [Bacteroidota bacterium]|jgi:hypothetical protein|nr:hypothetical protein [Bacteroidota bacterium]MEC8758627.1 hypothetical protein [Bacteroidota bacterium]
MTDRVHLIAERIWGLVTVLALGLALYDIATRGWAGGKTSLLFPAIAGAWYFTRRGVRRKIDASAEREADRSA